MKKILKSILSVTLALIMSFGTLTAFAAEGDKVNWDNGWWIDEYSWAGKAKIGTNTVVCNEEAYQTYYDFNAENAGYYTIVYDQSIIDWAGFPLKFDGKNAAGESYVAYTADESEIITVLVKLEAGHTVLGVDYYNSEITSADITVDYLGDAIADIVVDEEKTVDYVDGYDIYCEYSEGAMLIDYEVIFTSEKTLKFENSRINFKCENYAEGKNTVVISFDEFEKEITVTVSAVKSIVKSAELSNYENYTTITYNYEGYNDMHWIYDESVKITFTNGETFTAPITAGEGLAIFPNGKEYEVFVDYEHNNEGLLVLAVYVAGEKITEYECTETNAGFIDNLGSLINENDREHSYFFNDIIGGFESIFYSESIAAAFEAIREFFFDFLISLSDLSNGLFRNIMYFFRYYLASV